MELTSIVNERLDSVGTVTNCYERCRRGERGEMTMICATFSGGLILSASRKPNASFAMET